MVVFPTVSTSQLRAIQIQESRKLVELYSYGNDFSSQVVGTSNRAAVKKPCLT